MKDRTVRILMTIVGIAILGLSIGFFSASDFGFDPFQTFCRGIFLHSRFSYGTLYLIVSAVELAVIAIVDKSKIGLGTILNLALLGYIADFFGGIIKNLADSLGNGLPVRVICLLIGVVLLGFASAVYFTSDMGVSTHDAVALIASEKQDRIKFQYLRIADDFLCVIIGFILGQKFGIGTLFAMILTGPLVTFFSKYVSEPFFRKFTSTSNQES